MKLFEVTGNHDLGDHWNRVKSFAKLQRRKLWLVAENYAPDPDRWDGVVIEMPMEDREDFICEVVSSLKPDEIKMIDSTKLYLWWD